MDKKFLKKKHKDKDIDPLLEDLDNHSMWTSLKDKILKKLGLC